MGILNTFFGGKSVAITSMMIRAEIDRSEAEISRLNAEIGPKLAAIATMTDTEHVAAEGDIATTKRAIARLDARVAHLSAELPAVIAAEEATAKATADDDLRKRAESARKANEKEAAKLLAEYDKSAAQIGDILARLEAIDSERDAVNEALRANPIAEFVVGYSDNYRKHLGREASERREMRPVWVHGNGTVEIARLDQSGNPVKADRIWSHMKQGYENVNLEQREVVVSRVMYRPGHYEPSLTGIVLPAAFAGSTAHWPRKS